MHPGSRASALRAAGAQGQAGVRSMGFLPIRELARIPARDPTGDSGLPSPRLTGPEDQEPELLRAGRARFALPGDPWPCGGSGRSGPQGRREGSRRFRCCTRMCNQRNPAAGADLSGRMPERRKALGRVSLPTFFARAKKVGRSPKASGSPCSKKQNSKNWIPAFAGMTSERAEQSWIPASARMTSKEQKRIGRVVSPYSASPAQSH